MEHPRPGGEQRRWRLRKRLLMVATAAATIGRRPRSSGPLQAPGRRSGNESGPRKAPKPQRASAGEALDEDAVPGVAARPTWVSEPSLGGNYRRDAPLRSAQTQETK
ncbi:hypothetical protein MTO96_006932 [Rhipicephalus appendiculatus]